MKISFIQPSRNNLKYLKWSYDAIRKNQGNHTVEICVADDFSNDGTWEWCQKKMEVDSNFKAIRNDGPKRIGHTILYDRLINEVSSHDICMIYHADMYLCPGALDSIEKYIAPKTIVSLTRIEPPLHPKGPEKVLLDCGIEPEEFNEEKLLSELNLLQVGEKTTEGIFAPWAFMKADFQEIGGHDPLYAPQSKEDSDIFNRFQLNGVKFIQTWQGFVYHMTCRGSRFNPTLTEPGKNSSEWEEQNLRSTRNFIRKWGSFVSHDELLKPVITHKYDIGIVLKNCTLPLLELSEIFCSNIYVDLDSESIQSYIDKEQPNTKFNLSDRIRSIDSEKVNDIIVEFDGNNWTQAVRDMVIHLPSILTVNEIEVGMYELDFCTIYVKNVIYYENNLIKL